mmetsp:Transcript_30622/g.64168  ORF Transcript_30622/g.64168 Transcript_30622/m.64168 type:complete len:246 (+) Transcript_30622:822-1559(+)
MQGQGFDRSIDRWILSRFDWKNTPNAQYSCANGMSSRIARPVQCNYSLQRTKHFHLLHHNHIRPPTSKQPKQKTISIRSTRISHLVLDTRRTIGGWSVVAALDSIPSSSPSSPPSLLPWLPLPSQWSPPPDAPEPGSGGTAAKSLSTIHLPSTHTATSLGGNPASSFSASSSTTSPGGRDADKKSRGVDSRRWIGTFCPRRNARSFTDESLHGGTNRREDGAAAPFPVSLAAPPPLSAMPRRVVE